MDQASKLLVAIVIVSPWVQNFNSLNQRFSLINFKTFWLFSISNSSELHIHTYSQIKCVCKLSELFFNTKLL